MSGSNPIFIAFLVVYCTGASGAIVYGFIELWRAMSSTEWPEVTGQIESTRTATDPARQATGGALSLPTEYVTIRYRYRMGDHEFTGWRIGFGTLNISPRRDYGGTLNARYPNHRQVSVLVSPDDPALSVLEPGVSWRAAVVPLIGALLLGNGLRFLLPMLGS